MKPLFITLLVCLSICVAMSLFSCKKKREEAAPTVEKPKIQEVSVIPTPRPDNICGALDDKVIHLQSKQKLKLKLKVSAAKGLSQYKIDIHHNFDCHSHRLEATQSVVWQVIKVVNISGTEHLVDEELEVPENVRAGNYHFMLHAIDIEGNEAALELYSLKISNDADLTPPDLTVQQPASDSITIMSSDSIPFRLKIEDNRVLKGGKIEITYFDSQNTEFTVDQYFFPNNTNTSADYMFVHRFVIAPNGNLVFVLKAFDAVGNFTEKRLKVHVQN